MIKKVDYHILVGIILASMKQTNNEVMHDLNAMPVNVRARELLEGSGKKPGDDSLYCAQAALLALETGLVEAESDVVETLTAMISWRPQRIVNFLMLMYIDEYDPPHWKDAPGLKEFAAAILDDVEEKMVKHFPYYRSSES
jgi:hypothetical protein